MGAEDRWIVTSEMMKGFNALANEAGTEVTGGQSVLNPWPIIGGVAMAVCHKDDFVAPTGLQVGDVMVLTKPLGTQLAVNMRQQFNKADESKPLFAKTKDILSADDVALAFSLASESMEHLNRTAARLMRRHGAHGATDVTGFGIQGHANNLAVAQPVPLKIFIDVMPVIKGMDAVDRVAPAFNLMSGGSAETSGGLLVAFPTGEAAEAFIADLAAEDRTQGWVVGRITERPPSDEINSAAISPESRVVSVDKFFLS
eukprot:gene1192-1847_t